ncbi:MAG: hypothetical protein KatS3mg031_1513 [Chitinophagales bacterium]|nr:MAG: hypothetical protein KatS3mg031_1513 [Chitinophagales bacterium]
MKRFSFFSAFFLLLSIALHASQDRKVLIIGIDGCRSDALLQANTPNIDTLLTNSLYSFDSWHVGITWSGPSWSSILTGVHWNKHGVTDNSFNGSNFNQYAPFPKLAKTLKPNLKRVEVVEWGPLADDFYNDGWDEKIKVADGSTFPTADSAVIQLQDPDLDVLFVYFDKVDLTGHVSTFSPANPLYINAIQDVDHAIGTVLSALYARSTFASENWLILLVTDHGGRNFSHGGNSYEERRVWWIASGRDVPHNEVSSLDPGTYNCQLNAVFDPSCVDFALIRESPVHTDIAVTALHHLIYDTGVHPETKSEWELYGKSWLSPPTAIADVQSQTKFIIAPDPASGEIVIYSSDEALQPAELTVFDVMGREIPVSPQLFNNNIRLNLAGAIPGTYILHINLGNGSAVKKIILTH